MLENILDGNFAIKNDAHTKEQHIKHKPNLSSNLKKLLLLANISEHELGRRTKIAQPIIHRILSGKNINPKLMTLKPIADYFMVTLSQLIGEQEIASVWKGYTSKDHHGWSEIPILNWEEAKKTDIQTTLPIIISECLVSQFGFAIYMLNASMEPIIPKNSVVIVEPKIEPSHGDAVALKDNDQIIIRNFLIIDKKPCITPINQEFGSLSQLTSNKEIQGTVIRTIYDPRVVAKK